MEIDVSRSVKNVEANFYETLEQDKPKKFIVTKPQENVKNANKLCMTPSLTLEKTYLNTS